jgi:hypothetical protein
MKKYHINKISLVYLSAILVVFIAVILFWVTQQNKGSEASARSVSPDDLHYVTGKINIVDETNRTIAPANGYTIVLGGIGKSISKDGTYSITLSESGCLDIQIIDNLKKLNTYQLANTFEQQTCIDQLDRNLTRNFNIIKITK